ncbi:tRNA 2'-phosphotransferase [Trichosporon asahii var. asahii CBS 2479]|uniref:2'-phosphotransferase n=1 Tax=Trichosporon asahii var. asahii (strain ATCC 90039 / CBS 2479 / JCM 2466 / KCTC 7840 / NBRC 103889/ NCYC 2677 / UAMH 7654) TaxID=1186058 RepID=J5QFE9_TRIAS|nr:tRNA 2'-phosphotransferase [Trichosporon asahii var. asahii CBS 2479]EJT47068.1 tRNA 2'-phosphotransferase [Trichosporon asahii var. asahii CBS 2479]
MPRPNDSPDVAASKTMAYILRHGAEKEGLHMRSDGLILLDDVMKAVDRPTVFRLVNENAKKRFELLYGYDPSPPKPKKTKAPKKKPAPKATDGEATGATAAGSVDALAAQLDATTVEPTWKELEFVALPAPAEGEQGDQRGAWYIRASQGHTLKVEDAAMLEPILDNEDGRRRAGLLVHGTQWKLWDTLIPRPNSTLHIFLSLPLLLAASIPVYSSANGVVLTPGDANGFVPKEFWRMAVHISEGKRTVVWEDGKETERVEDENEAEQ